MPFKAQTIGEAEFMSAYDLDETGAVLVRPDGYVGWRSRTKASNPRAALGEAITDIMGLNG